MVAEPISHSRAGGIPPGNEVSRNEEDEPRPGGPGGLRTLLSTLALVLVVAAVVAGRYLFFGAPHP